MASAERSDQRKGFSGQNQSKGRAEHDHSAQRFSERGDGNDSKGKSAGHDRIMRPQCLTNRKHSGLVDRWVQPIHSSSAAMHSRASNLLRSRLQP